MTPNAMKLGLALLLVSSAANAEAPKKRTVVSTPSGYSPYASADSSTFSATRLAAPAYSSYASPSFGYASPSFAYAQAPSTYSSGAPSSYSSGAPSAAYKQATFTPSLPYNEQPAASYRPSYAAATYSPVQHAVAYSPSQQAVAYNPAQQSISYSPVHQQAFAYNPTQQAVAYKAVPVSSYRPSASTSLPGYAANFAALGDFSSGAHYTAGINPGIYSGLGLNAYSGLADYSGLSAYQPVAYNFGGFQQQPAVYQQQAAYQPQASYQQQAFPQTYSAAPAGPQQQLVAQATNKVGPATFGTHGGVTSSPASSGVSNGGYGFTRAPPS